MDDSAINLKLMQTYLIQAQFDVLLASDGRSALELARARSPQLVLLDLQMPEMDGYAVCRELKQDEKTRNIPVIFITAERDSAAETLAFAQGGADYITKPINREVTLARVRTHIALYGQRRSLEGMFRDVIEFAPDAFILTDEQGVIVRMNACAERLFGYRRKEMQGQRLDHLVPNLTLNGRSNIECRRQDGSVFPADVSATPMETNRGKLRMAVVRDVSERQKAESDLKRSRQQLRDLAAKSEAAREAERKHIAREVHDELGQILTALRIDLSVLKMQSAEASAALNDKLVSMKSLVDQGIQAVRNVAVSLRPAALDMGLIPAIEWLCEHYAKLLSATIEFQSSQESVSLDETRSVVIFRIVQESLTNIARYANASQVRVAVELSENDLSVRVQDDGQGFDVAQATGRKTFGLLGMRERALALGGTMEIVSAPGSGTQVTVRIPMETEHAKGYA
ncbi:MAG: response regulator [Rhodoferax sp.]